MSFDRAKLAQNAPAVLMAFDQVKGMLRIEHDEMLATIAAALACMPDADRAVFRALFDQIEQEMTEIGSRPPEHRTQ